ncbi:MAG: CoA transferase [Marinobacter sp.]
MNQKLYGVWPGTAPQRVPTATIGAIDSPCRHFEETLLPELAALAQSLKAEDQHFLNEALKAWIPEHTLAHWQALFQIQDACVEPVLSIAEAANHPQIMARGLVRDVDRGDGAMQKQIGSPIRFVSNTTTETDSQ